MVQRVALHPKPRPRFIEPMECQRVASCPKVSSGFTNRNSTDTIDFGEIPGLQFLSSDGRWVFIALLFQCRIVHRCAAGMARGKSLISHAPDIHGSIRAP